MKTLTIAFLALSIGSASAQQPIVLHSVARDRVAPTYFSTLPPIEYDHPFKGKVKITVVDNEAEMQTACGMPGVVYLMGCAHLDGKVCVIHLRDEETLRRNRRTRLDILLRHEVGHCNGWRGHAGARVMPADVGMVLLGDAVQLLLYPIAGNRIGPMY